MKIHLTIVVSLLSMYFQSAFAIDSDELRIEKMLKTPESIIKFEALAKDGKDDTPEIKRCKDKLKNSIEDYKKSSSEIRSKYAEWLNSTARRDELIKKLEGQQESGFLKMVSTYSELILLKLKISTIAPVGEKGAVNEITDHQRLQGLKIGIEFEAQELKSTIKEKHSSRSDSK
ncbi:MAG: hypothetical protein HOP07_06135 [Bacteriovoracaceae bacterium]|nr:hypothetical protein [Bacteriovoracaceae bacterium]